ncbi:DUF3800 domain-containing protein [Thermoanaerobacterium sp. CMT5567-10]|jgi:hypothetical protein|uniref:DUF3800 domain-containing protein n=1 Tax=Thermoanaerobacterium sp. CMT5567-10 TaxID=3061989 RepID=UPI0026E01A78|nr:DUF3800 domain-containing protein [Thermoanaerobacterium sp. CMT5567-10]WKV08214.1 DUF3800 domain-containing protein [Thermoanaerobacterium sp. CMT5567-10]
MDEQTINIYCDESCHLEHDGNDIMVLGAITSPECEKENIFKIIREIKMKHGLNSWIEVKWTKISDSKVDLYIELIDYFFNNPNLSFRSIIATNKSKLDHIRYNKGSYDLWYYKMYFYLLDPLIDPSNKYRIFIDIKDTKGGPRIKKLHEVLCNNIYDFNQDVIKDIKQISSKESEILQLADILIGALSYYQRNLYETSKNKGKKSVIERIITYNINMSQTTSRSEKKFNIFIWEPRGITNWR